MRSLSSALACVALLACQPSSSLSSSSSSDAVASVRDLDDRPVDVFADDGRVEALVFLRTDCPISNRYAPELGRIARRFEDRPVTLWRVYVDADETPAQIREHARAYALPGRAVRDPRHELVARAGVEVTPSVAVFDRGGERRYVGRIDDWYADYGKPRPQATTHEMIDALEATLAGRTPAVASTSAVGCPVPPVESEVEVEVEAEVEAEVGAEVEVEGGAAR